MKLGIFTWGLSAGAFANVAAALAQGFWNEGVRKLSLIYLSRGPERHASIPEGVTIVSLGVSRARWASPVLAGYLREAKLDVLVSMPAFINIPAILGWLLGGRNRTKLVITEHATMSYKAFVEHKHNPWMRALPYLARFLYPRANGLVANSQCVLDDLLMRIRVPMQNGRITAIPNPVDIKMVRNRSLVLPDHPWLLHKKKPVIVSVGRLARQKNFPLLLKAYAIVRQRLDARLIILGEGPERGRLESLITALGLGKDISLPGFSPNPWSIIARADAFVLPSEEEGFGLVLVEAMACGIPVVATDAIGGGPRSILENGRYGILVRAGDVAALADAISNVISSGDLRDGLLVSGKQRCEIYRPEVVAQQWLSFVEGLG